MAKLENKGQRGLPPPPAPTRRSANPWGFSDTARKREAPPPRAEVESEQLLEELVADKPQPESPPRSLQPLPAEERRPQSLWRPRRKSVFWPLLVLLLIAGVVIKLFTEARESGEWREIIPAIFAILFIAHAIWRSRRRRDGRADPDEQG